MPLEPPLVKARSRRSNSQQLPWNLTIAILTVLTALIAIGTVVWLALYSRSNPTTASTSILATGTEYPIGVSDKGDPSGVSPPGPDALAGYKLKYVNNFDESSIPVGWNVFTGNPGGGNNHQFASTHVVISGGVLHLNTWRDSSYKNNWVTGGICQCGVADTYGAYFVRSRVTGAGPTAVELLWPASNVWPPEIDFNETGGDINSTSATVHIGITNQIIQWELPAAMNEWHTWGVIWTPTSITFSVDGHAWGSDTVPSEVPSQPMTLDLEQRAVCIYGRGCPTAPESLLVDWVAEYVHN